MPIDYSKRDRRPAEPPVPPASSSTTPAGTTAGTAAASPAGPSSMDPQPTPPTAAGKIDVSRPRRAGSAAAPAAPPAAAPAAPPAAAPAAPAQPSPAPISLSKVTLTKSAPTVKLTKSGQSQGVMRVNLNWQSRGTAKGFMAKLTGSDSIDLDLGCLYELSDGSKSGIQALGGQFGALRSSPWIQLDGDDRSGASVGGENLLINLEQPGRFKRILIFAMIYKGATRWADAHGVVTLYPTAGPEIEVQLDGDGSDTRVCAIALLENTNGELVARREVNYIRGSQKVLDETYQWGLQWAPGTK